MNLGHLDHVSDEELVIILGTTKNGVLNAIDRGKTAQPPFEIGLMVLETLEREMRKRGMDPTDEEKYGKDIIGQIIRIKMEDAVK